MLGTPLQHLRMGIQQLGGKWEIYAQKTTHNFQLTLSSSEKSRSQMKDGTRGFAGELGSSKRSCFTLGSVLNLQNYDPTRCFSLPFMSLLVI